MTRLSDIEFSVYARLGREIAQRLPLRTFPHRTEPEAQSGPPPEPEPPPMTGTDDHDRNACPFCRAMGIRTDHLAYETPLRPTVNATTPTRTLFAAYLGALEDAYPAPPTADAEARARDLLVSMLTNTQRAQLRRYDQFGVIGSLGGRYILNWSYVWGIDPSNHLAAYCFQPADPYLPNGDKVLGRKIWIEANEGYFLNVAVKSPFGDPFSAGLPPGVRTAISRLTAEVLAGT